MHCSKCYLLSKVSFPLVALSSHDFSFLLSWLVTFLLHHIYLTNCSSLFLCHWFLMSQWECGPAVMASHTPGVLITASSIPSLLQTVLLFFLCHWFLVSQWECGPAVMASHTPGVLVTASSITSLLQTVLLFFLCHWFLVSQWECGPAVMASHTPGVLVTASADKTIRIWDSRVYEPVTCVCAHAHTSKHT